MNKTLNICLLVARDGWGGSETQASLLVDGLRAQGHRVDIWLVERGTKGGPLTQRGARALGPSRGGRIRQVGQTARNLLRFRRVIASQKYDLVHAAMARAYVTAPLAAATLRHAPPVVAWRRNLGVHLGSSRVRHLVERVSARRTALIICNSETVREYWTAIGVVGASQARVVHNCLADWRFAPSGIAASRPDTFQLISVGGLKPVKNHALLIEAASLVRTARVGVLIVGSGAEREALIEEAQNRQVELVMAGHVADSREFLETADIYVHPSRSEGMSNAILEAMAAGKAIVATNVGAAAELLTPDRGILVPSEDAGALASALDHLIADTELRQRLGQAARAWVSDGFSVSAVARQHLQFYRQAMQGVS